MQTLQTMDKMEQPELSASILIHLSHHRTIWSHDSQRRFQNDLFIDNLIAKTVGDYDGDGFQEVIGKRLMELHF